MAFGVTALVSAVLDMTLPESLNKLLPETIMDIENRPVIPVPHPEKPMLSTDEDKVRSDEATNGIS